MLLTSHLHGRASTLIKICFGNHSELNKQQLVRLALYFSPILCSSYHGKESLGSRGKVGEVLAPLSWGKAEEKT